MSTAIKIKGITDEVNTCECCGRTNLKSTVVLEINESVVHFGSLCAALAMGRRNRSDVERLAVKAQAEVDRAKEIREFYTAFLADDSRLMRAFESSIDGRSGLMSFAQFIEKIRDDARTAV